MSVKNYTINNIFLQNFHYFGNGKFKFLNKVEVQVLGLGLWCLTPLSTIFQLLYYIILLQSVLLVDETGEPGENHRPAASH
jgi:hypothetical protein